jgi:uncharacterized protein YdcH (DUF465 family)
MQIEPHDLLSEFPEHKENIHNLKMSDNHFRRLFDDYHALDRSIHRLETGIEYCSDEELEDLKKKRLLLKDEIYVCLQKAA